MGATVGVGVALGVAVGPDAALAVGEAVGDELPEPGDALLVGCVLAPDALGDGDIVPRVVGFGPTAAPPPQAESDAPITAMANRRRSERNVFTLTASVSRDA